jgi:transposase InsO family protein
MSIVDTLELLDASARLVRPDKTGYTPGDVAPIFQANVKLDRQRLDKHWQQRRKRVRYDVELAERRYQAVYPENRLVASSLEKKWDQTLRYERQFEEEYDRFLHAIPDVWGVTLHGMNSFIDQRKCCWSQ